jgi:3-oxoacyl-[acyl-carrier protein] reductase
LPALDGPRTVYCIGWYRKLKEGGGDVQPTRGQGGGGDRGVEGHRRGIARGLAEAGASVVVNYASDRAGADRVVTEVVERGGKAVAVQGDVSKAADVKRLFAEAVRTFGRLDVLVNNAGVYRFGPIESVTEEELRRHYDTNASAPSCPSRRRSSTSGPGAAASSTSARSWARPRGRRRPSTRRRRPPSTT